MDSSQAVLINQVSCYYCKKFLKGTSTCSVDNTLVTAPKEEACLYNFEHVSKATTTPKGR